MTTYDVIIIGGGPAGLNAALILGRCRRNVALFDHEAYRNACSRHLHGFLSRDGIQPQELLKIGREQLREYPSVQIKNSKIVHAEKRENLFFIKEENGQIHKAKKLLLATGVVDIWPEIKGAKEMYGKSIVHCPYCDGWERRDQPIAVLCKDKNAAEFCLELLLWSKDITLCTNGPAEISSEFRNRLAKYNIQIREEPVTELIGKDGKLEKIVFQKGEPIHCKFIFFSNPIPQRSQLPSILGCEFDKDGSVVVGKFESTNVPGLFVAGDASKDVMMAVIAAAEGVQAAMAINSALIKEATK